MNKFDNFFNQEDFNRTLIKKYPWLAIREDDDSVTWLDIMPPGWRKAFGLQMVKDIQKALDREPKQLRDSFQITDVKEKFGSLRVYSVPYIEGVEEMIDKYNNMSQHFCCYCGKCLDKPTFMPLCDACRCQICVKTS